MMKLKPIYEVRLFFSEKSWPRMVVKKKGNLIHIKKGLSKSNELLEEWILSYSVDKSWGYWFVQSGI